MVLETVAPAIPLVPLAAFAVILFGGLLPKERGFGGTTSTVVGTVAVGVSLVLSAYLLFTVWTRELEAFVTAETVWVDGIGEVPDLTVGVLEEYRRYGIGSHLLQRGLEWANSQGYEKIYQSLPATNEEAIAFLKAHDWETEAVRADHYRIDGEYVDETMMARAL